MAVHATVTCPECGKTLKPKKPLPGGKKVKCPQCDSLFVTPSAGGEAPKGKAQAGGPRKKASAKAAPDDKGIPLVPLAADEEDEGGIYTYLQDITDDEDKPDIDHAPDTSIKDLRGPAQAIIVGPSNWLIFKGFLGFVGWLGFLVLLLIPVLFPLPEDDGEDGQGKPAPAIGMGLGVGAGARPGGGGGGVGFPGGGQFVPPPTQEPKKEEEKPNPSFFEILGLDLRVLALFPWFLIILFCLPMVVFMVYSAIICFGGVKMQNLESRAWGIASAVMLILPLNAGGVMLVSCLVEQAFFRLFIDDEAFLAYMFIVTIVIEWLIQVAIGVWALLTCFKPEVIDGFEYQPE